MKLNDKQHLFSRLWCEFYLEADRWLERFYGHIADGPDPIRRVIPIIGIGYVPPQLRRAYIERLGGHERSLHYFKLAAHLLLIERHESTAGIQSEFVFDATAYTPLGVMWKEKNKLCSWGGDFGSQDATHFSLEHQGMK